MNGVVHLLLAASYGSHIKWLSFTLLYFFVRLSHGSGLAGVYFITARWKLSETYDIGKVYLESRFMKFIILRDSSVQKLTFPTGSDAVFISEREIRIWVRGQGMTATMHLSFSNRHTLLPSNFRLARQHYLLLFYKRRLAVRKSQVPMESAFSSLFLENVYDGCGIGSSYILENELFFVESFPFIFSVLRFSEKVGCRHTLEQTDRVFYKSQQRNWVLLL